MIDCAADVAIDAFNAGDLNLLFLRAGLGESCPWGGGYGKSALVNSGITTAMWHKDEPSAQDGLNEFVRLVAERVAPRTPDQDLEPGSPFWRLREAARYDGFDLRARYADAGQHIAVRFLPLEEPAAPLSAQITALEDDFVRLRMTVALIHYRQTVKNFVEQDSMRSNA